MQDLLKQIEAIISDSNISENEKEQIFNLLKKIDKKVKKTEFKLESVLKRDKETKTIMTAMLQEIEAQKNTIKEIHEELLASEEELRQNYEELQTANEHLLSANELIREKNLIIEKSHKHITDSINYAISIQNSLLTKKEVIDTFLSEYFIWLQPKDKIGGDFYYINKINNKIIIAIADCTGHGIPGGFMAVLAISFLHEIIRRKEAQAPNELLELLRRRIKDIFSASGAAKHNGLDIALCFIDTETNIMQFAGAYSPLIIIRNNEIKVYKGTRNPIGYYPKEIKFQNQIIELQKNDNIYMLSDGFQDQYSEKFNEKFYFANLKKLLLEIHKLPMNEQKEKLIETFNKWKGKREQTDDIIIFGMRY